MVEPLFSYVEATHNSTWRSKIWSNDGANDGETIVLSHNIRKIGKTVSLELPEVLQFQGTNPLNDTIRLTTPLPEAFRPRAEVYFPLLVQSNLTQMMGGAIITTAGTITLAAGVPLSVFSALGPGGIQSTVVSYLSA